MGPIGCPETSVTNYVTPKKSEDFTAANNLTAESEKKQRRELVPRHEKMTDDSTERREAMGWNASDHDKEWRAVVNMVMNLRFPLLNLLIQVSDALLNGLRNVEAIYIT
jgi:hypothetical protein